MVAKVKDKIVGFVVGTLNSDLLYQDLFRNKFFSIAKLAFKRFLISKNFRSQVRKRMHFIKNALKIRFFVPKRHDTEEEIESKSAYSKLLSIAVLKDFQGKGASSILVRTFEKEIHKRGALVCTLSVRKENLRAINFYKKAGWQLSKITEESIIFLKNLSKS